MPPDNSNLAATRVVVRPIANPLSLGFLAVFFGTVMLAAQELAWVPASEGHQLDLGILVFTGPALLVACLWGFAGRDTVAATGFGVQAGVWGIIGLTHYLSPPGSRSPALAVLLAAGAAALLMPVVGALNSKVLAGLTMGTTVVRWSVTAAYELVGGTSMERVSGGFGLLLAAVCLYSALAFELEEQQRRTVLPTLRRKSGAVSLVGDLADQVTRVDHEAGVRRTL